MLALIPDSVSPKAGTQPLPASDWVGMSYWEKKLGLTASLHFHLYLNNLTLLEGRQNTAGVRSGVMIRVEA